MGQFTGLGGWGWSPQHYHPFLIEHTTHTEREPMTFNRRTSLTVTCFREALVIQV